MTKDAKEVQLQISPVIEDRPEVLKAKIVRMANQYYNTTSSFISDIQESIKL